MEGGPGSDAVRGEEDVIQYGLKDLVIAEDMLRCTSSLEHSYGFGMANDVTNTFLAGQQIFSVDEVEIWRVGRAFEASLAQPFEGVAPEAGNYSDDESQSSFDSFNSEFSAGTFSTSTGYTESKKAVFNRLILPLSLHQPDTENDHLGPLDTNISRKTMNKKKKLRRGRIRYQWHVLPLIAV